MMHHKGPVSSHVFVWLELLYPRTLKAEGEECVETPGAEDVT